MNDRSTHLASLAVGSFLFAFAPTALAQVEDIGADDVKRFFISSTGEAGAGQRLGPNGQEVFRWFADGTLEALVTPAGVPGAPQAVSDDGSIVCGRAIGPADLKRTIRWDAAGVPTDISIPGTLVSLPIAMSRDGATIALNNQYSNGLKLAAMWTAAAGREVIVPTLGYEESEILLLSQDGSTGFGRFTLSTSTAVDYFLWSSTSGVSMLPDFPSVYLFPNGISADGSVIVGLIKTTAGEGIFRWRAVGGFETFTPPFTLDYTRVSADGSTIYGANSFALLFNGQSFRWTEAGGFVTFSNPEQVSLTGSSADGSTIVGNIGLLPYNPSRAFRDSTATGFGFLDSFPGDTSVTSISLDGSIAGGLRITANGVRGVIWRTDGSLGESYCGPGVTNSAGLSGEMSLAGSAISEHGSLTLQASGLPPFSFGFFIASNSDGFASMPGGSQGNLCLGGAIGRFADPGQIANSGAAGTISLEIDPRTLPGPNGPILPMFGERWYFQGWHRDANPSITSNFTDGVTVQIF